ncbi:chitin synthase-domain-containing protein [Mycena rebaudengoi]|nr:chitin synthase-domain-containing protein [Mycena rebaudengoi]
MMVGSSNDRRRSRIVLEILGTDPNLDPEPLNFLSLSEGAKQHNMGKVYLGLYTCKGHVAPYLAIYRPRTSDTHKLRLLQLIADYFENRGDMLHKKNLLHLLENRYLTMLLLGHFPLYKTQFVRDAHAYTVALNDWKILLSQRLAGSTRPRGAGVLRALCGFCYFSMHFIIIIDIFSTLTQPVSVVYLTYLVAARGEQIQTVSLFMIIAIYAI